MIEENRHGDIQRIVSKSAPELKDEYFAPLIYFVTGFLHQGYSMIVGDPKAGKSLFVLQLCLCVSSGLPFLGFETKRCGCLIISYEDSFRRLRDRLLKMSVGLGLDKLPDNFYFATTAGTMDSGLMVQIDSFMEEHPDIGIIVVDVLERARSPEKGNRNAYRTDVKEMSQFKDIADKHNICLIGVHHTRKGR